MEELTIWEQHTITLSKVSVWSGGSECVWFETGVGVEGAGGVKIPRVGSPLGYPDENGGQVLFLIKKFRGFGYAAENPAGIYSDTPLGLCAVPAQMEHCRNVLLLPVSLHWISHALTSRPLTRSSPRTP